MRQKHVCRYDLFYVVISTSQFLQCIYIYIYDSGIVLNIVIPPLVTSCKILIIIVNFLAALAARKRCDFRLLLQLSNSILGGFPLSQVSVVLPFSKQCGKRFLLFCSKPYCCSRQNTTIQTDTFKTWMRK